MIFVVWGFAFLLAQAAFVAIPAGPHREVVLLSIFMAATLVSVVLFRGIFRGF